ncbi:MAG: hypothetical protein IJ652_05065 [Bacteroidales bacterium]|nr:hypothetical protein [Bacteroidales bacterium]
MKHIIQLLCIAAAIFTVSCKKALTPDGGTDNQVVKDIPQQDYELSIAEYSTNGYAPDLFYIIGEDCLPLKYTLNEDGTLTCDEHGLDELVITISHTVVVGGNGVDINVESSNENIVSVKKQRIFDGNSDMYTATVLQYAGDGTATITVWNGEKGGPTTKSFTVRAQEIIGIEALLVEADGVVQEVTKFFEDGDFWGVRKLENEVAEKSPEEDPLREYWAFTRPYRVFYDDNIPKMEHTYRIAGVRPVNTSYTFFSECVFNVSNRNNELDDNIYKPQFNGSHFLHELVTVPPQKCKDADEPFYCTLRPASAKSTKYPGQFILIKAIVKKETPY